MGKDGAQCFHTLKDGLGISYDKPTWDATREGWLCTPPESFSEWKKDLEELCAQSQKCTFETKQIMEKFFSRVLTRGEAHAPVTQPIQD